jgi:hypothetical protein
MDGRAGISSSAPRHLEIGDTTLNFTELVIAANDSKVGRNPGQWTPAACKIWREAEPEMSRLLESAFALELKLGRKVSPNDESAVREMRSEMDAATATVKTRVS